MSTTSVSSKLTYERFELIGKRSIGPLDEVIYMYQAYQVAVICSLRE